VRLCSEYLSDSGKGGKRILRSDDAARLADRWRLCTAEGDVIMQGSESSRPAAKYKADRALFLLLMSAPYQSIRLAARAEAVSKVTLGLALLVLSEITTNRQNLPDLLF
jgi:hypothetical protein